VDWKEVREKLSCRLENLDAGEVVNTTSEFLFQLGELTCIISGVIVDCVPKVGMLLYQKCWWSPLLSARHMELCRLTWRVFSKRLEPEDLVHLKQRGMRRAYGTIINNAKREHWEGFLVLLDKRTVWMAHCLCFRDSE